MMCALLAVMVSMAQAPPAGQPGKLPEVLPPAPETRPEPPSESAPQLTPSPEEAGVLEGLVSHASWVRRLVAAQRLERWPAEDYALNRLTKLAADKDVRVRAAAVLGLTRIGAKPIQERMDVEDDGRVIRTMLRCGWPVDAERVEKGAKPLLKSDVPSERLLGVEIVYALEKQKRSTRALTALAKETFLSVVARMEREDAGHLSPRLATLTGAPDSRIDYKWRSWLNRNRISLTLDGGSLLPVDGEDRSDAVTKLSSSEFVRFATELEQAFKKPIDLAIAIDCTASMSSELAQAQAGINDVMQFASAAAGGVRMAVVGYRDYGDDWTTRASDFTESRKQAQANLWQLRADGGGDEPEMVYQALRIAYGQFSWRGRDDKVQRVLVLVGDAPPHPGFGAMSVDLAKAGKAAGITTYVLSARSPKKDDEVKHFPEIARAGGGRVIRLGERTDLAAEIAGVALADTWHDPIVAIFERYLLLCR
jgi:hypothetical protein